VDANGTVVVAGGTGLYLRAALGVLELPPPPADGARDRWSQAYDADREATYSVLAERDPRAASVIHVNDRSRVVRAPGVARTGASLGPAADRLWSEHTRRPTLIVGLDLPGAELERRIAARTTAMFERGVVDEVSRALTGPVSRTAEKALGLREIAALSPDDARERVIVRTRQYAAYQRKWMRRIPKLTLVDATR